MNLILLGAPGAGKGTQSAILSERLNIPAISTGNILRAAMKEGTPDGVIVKEYMDAGQLVPDAIIIDIVHKRLEEADCANGFILDGVPRTVEQAEELENVGILFDAVISLEMPDEVILERISGRRICDDCGASYHVTNVPPKHPGVCDRCGGKLVQRKDDVPETVKQRLTIYYEKTAPLKDYYAGHGILKPVEMSSTVERNTEMTLNALTSVSTK